MPDKINKKDLFFDSRECFLGGNLSQDIGRIIYIDPQEYIKLPLSDKYQIARIVGNLNRTISSRDQLPTMLMGPGRWGTTTPSLGVPVKFAEINNVAALVEIAFPEGNLMPELSLGTHFFQDLVETNIFYIALFPEKKEVVFSLKLLKQFKNSLEELTPQAVKYKNVVSVYDLNGQNLSLISDVVSQRVLCFSKAGNNV